MERRWRELMGWELYNSISIRLAPDQYENGSSLFNVQVS